MTVGPLLEGLRSTRLAALVGGRRRAWDACPGCGSLRGRLLHQLRGFAVVRCHGCGLARTTPAPQYEGLYDDDAGFAEPYAEQERLFRGFHRQTLRLLWEAGARGRLLDVGTATGTLLEEAARLGFQAEGLEPNRAAVEVARGRGRHVHQGYLEDDGVLPGGSYDVVVMSHVLEHLPEPLAQLRRVRGLLRRSGYLLVVVPHFCGLLPQLAPSLWSYWDPARHLWHFDAPALTRLLQGAGFRVLRVARQSAYHPFRPEGAAPILSWLVQPALAGVGRLAGALGLGDQLSVVAVAAEGAGRPRRGGPS